MTAAYLNAALASFREMFDCEPLRIDLEDGIVWAIVASPAIGVNGYAMIPPKGHPWSAGFPSCDDDDELELDELIDVHGGVTYAQYPWIGFDTGHAFDLWPAEYDPLGVNQMLHGMHSAYPAKPGLPTRRWTVDLVAEETRNLARQLARVQCPNQKKSSSPTVERQAPPPWLANLSEDDRAAIAEQVGDGPDLSDRQRERLRLLFRPRGGAS